MPRVSFGEVLDDRRRRKKCVVYVESPLMCWVSWIRHQDVEALASLRVFSEVVFRVISINRRRLKVGLQIQCLSGIEVGVRWVLGTTQERGIDAEGSYVKFRPYSTAIEDSLRARWKLMNWEASLWSEEEKRIDDDAVRQCTEVKLIYSSR